MSGSGQQPESKPGRPLTIRAIVLGGLLVGLVGAAAVVALIYFYGRGTDQDRARLDVVRVAGALVFGTGGAIALLLTARRQRSTELTLEHQRKIASVSERDAAEQRLTELYIHAVDQLGNEKAPVRLGGLYALERVAQNNPDQRQTIVDVICAYLRMPYTPPENKPPTEDAPAEAHTRHEQRRQELQVRMTAQRILAVHLRHPAEDKFWANIDLDLSEAHLYSLDLTNCHVRNSHFDDTQFGGDARFDSAQFGGEARFDSAQFGGEARFDSAQFGGDARFDSAQFGGDARFNRAQFGGDAVLDGARFSGNAWFDGARFSGDVSFSAQFDGDVFFGALQIRETSSFFGVPVVTRECLDGAEFVGAKFVRTAFFDGAGFGGEAQFGGVQFARAAAFRWARFVGTAKFGEAKFGEDVLFDEARARPGLQHSWPAGWTIREARLFEGEEEGWIYLTPIEGSIK